MAQWTTSSSAYGGWYHERLPSRPLNLADRRQSNVPAAAAPAVAAKKPQSLLDMLETYRLRERCVRGDGNCQFRALSDQLYNTEAAISYIYLLPCSPQPQPNHTMKARSNFILQRYSCLGASEGVLGSMYSTRFSKTTLQTVRLLSGTSCLGPRAGGCSVAVELRPLQRVCGP
eukprot:1658155-Amphidinium_carterae.1